MIRSPLHRETVTVTVVTRGVPDVDGVASRTTSTVTLTGCNVQLAATTETPDSSAVSSAERWRVSGPLAEQITPGCLAAWRGDPYEVDGAPAHFRGTGFLDHTEFVIVKRRG